MSNKYVTYDHDTHSLNIELPEALIEERDSIQQELLEQFGYDSINASVLERMNSFITQLVEAKERQ